MRTLRETYNKLQPLYEASREEQAYKNLEKAVRELNKKINDMYKEQLKQKSFRGTLKGASYAALGTAFVGVIISLGVTINKWYIKRYGLECMKSTGDARKKCVAQLMISAKRHQILVLRKKMVMCIAVTNPIQCEFKIKKQISNINDGITTLKGKL
jgi:hypothetical protein